MFQRITTILALVAVIATAVFTTLPQADEVQAQTFGKRVIEFKAITNTQRACASFPLADLAHVQVWADVTVVNTSTVGIQYTNDSVHFTAGDTLTSSVTTDTPLVAVSNLYTVSLRGEQTCVVVTPSTTDTITVTAVMFAPNRS